MPPNILFIMTDDIGWNDVGFHESTPIETPHLDGLAKTGLLLNNYYVQHVCTPSRSAFLTGKYPIRHGLQHHVILPGDPYGLDLNEYLLTEFLKKDSSHRYHTHLIGKWHLGYFDIRYTPIYRYFDTFYGFYMDMQNYYNHQRHHQELGIDFRNGTLPISSFPSLYSTFVYGNATNDLLLHYARLQRDPSISYKPFFIFLAYQAVHQPKQAPTEYINKYWKKIEDKDYRNMAAMMSALDDSVGEIVKTLKKSGLWENTLVIWSNDNGAGHMEAGCSNYPLRGGKNTLWEGGVKSIGAINGGALHVRRRGQISNALFHITDWFPTLMEWVDPSRFRTLAMQTKVSLMDGISQYQMIQFDNQSMDVSRHEVLLNIDPIRREDCEQSYKVYLQTKDKKKSSSSSFCTAAIRNGKWKLIVGKQSQNDAKHNRFTKHGWNLRSEYAMSSKSSVKCNSRLRDTCNDHTLQNGGCLFDLENDPCEFTDLSAAYPFVSQQLHRRLLHYQTLMTPPFQLTHSSQMSLASPSHFQGFWSPWLGPCHGYGDHLCTNITFSSSSSFHSQFNHTFFYAPKGAHFLLTSLEDQQSLSPFFHWLFMLVALLFNMSVLFFAVNYLYRKVFR
ncbi:arylsulfatase J precursor [Reticulomyxa filosa]|uniref:Arylsulfatase J n=1 Tax=Reticulomyxa filosa TaxID=46433 RepID=X6NSF8_RETFI|nr:arylsulfatase J precursor [Reticulomyxa filosa]|eukprot:ETO28267.1 arylsulfatase J precursor [Reticulomyxa filosa]